MEKQIEPLETLSEIRSMMERSSRFISLNGLSGVFAGIFALVGALAASIYLKAGFFQYIDYTYPVFAGIDKSVPFYVFFFADATMVLTASVAVAILLSVRKARKNGLKIWDSTVKRVLINMLIPLAAGGIFCLLLMYHGLFGLIAPITLIFYGMALINASKYTFTDILYLGMVEVLLGLASTFWIGYGLLFWALGFGMAHIFYGTIMYFKYER